MSYDLAVFDPAIAPTSRAKFDSWYDAQTEWEEGHEYDDPVVSTPALRAWFMEMIQQFPPMNGPYASKNAAERDDSNRLSDYSVGKHLIYVGFAWSWVESAYEACFHLAAKHGLGFLDASGDGGTAWIPDGKGGLKVAHKHGE